MTFRTTTLKSWSDIHSFSRDGWLFRGQAAAHDMKTSLERCCEREAIPAARRLEVELELIREFRRTYHQYATHVPDRRAQIEWLALMQHYGAPTRLLDFTYSIYVAAFFAIENGNAGEDAAVWAVNGRWVGRAAEQRLLAVGKRLSDVRKLPSRFEEGDEETLERLFFRKPFTRVVAPLNPFRLNERLRIQKGVFLVTGTPSAPFISNLRAMPGHDERTNVVKIIIPGAMRREAAKGLFTMNFTSTSLFPGLDGFARSLGFHHPVFDRARRGRTRRRVRRSAK